ncbi:quinone-interacting membrane-bound oxidoreductase complex subunit QmoC [Thermodesulfobacteriota bacterium]
MSEPYVVKPDREFLHGLLDEGGEDLKKCFQCATCSVVCELSTGPKPFPRKEMIWAQWGLKDKLVADPDVWTCHQCNDCSTKCPRGARPGDVLAAVRRQSVMHYATPKFLGKLAGCTKSMVLLLLVPVVLLTLALVTRGPVEKLLGFGEPHGFYAGFFPHWLIIGFYSSFAGLTTLAVLSGVIRFWGAMKAADEASGGYTPVVGLVPSIITTLKSIFVHDKFGKCQDKASRKLPHLLAFYGFVTLFVVTVYAVFDLYLFPLLGFGPFYPFGLLHPMKILANAGCVVLIYGCIKAILDRRGNTEESGGSTTFDWTFLYLLLIVAVTGLCTEILRFMAEPGAHGHGSLGGLQYTAFGVYFIHLVFVFALLMFLPYSKFAHIVYRTVALVYAEHSGRNVEVTAKA